MHRFRLVALFAILFVLNGERYFAQQYTYISYSVRQGLVQSQVRCLFEDRNGYIWAGTLGGVSRFDGSQFRNFTRENGLAGNQVSAITQLPDGRIAIGTVGSISIIDNDKVVSWMLPESHREITVNALYADQSGLWIGTESGLFFWDEGDPGRLHIDGLSDSEHIKTILPPVNQRTLTIVGRDAVYLVEEHRARLFFRPDDPEIYLFDATWSADEKLFIACRKEALIITSGEKTERSFGKADGLLSTTSSSVAISPDETIWLTSRFGVSRFYDGKMEGFDAADGLPTPDIRDVLIDREGNVWFASYGSGLIRFAGSALATFTTGDGLTSNAVMSITQDLSGSMWFATFDQGVCRQRGDTIVSSGIEAIGPGVRTWSALTDRSGTLWFGTSDGLVAVEPNKTRVYGVGDSLPDRTVLCLIQASDGAVYAGTGSGIVRIVNGKAESLKQIKGYPSTRVRGLTEDRAGNLWLATRDGVFKFDGKSFTPFGLAEGLPDLSSYCVHADPFNRIWVGTQAGLACLDGRLFRRVRISDTPGSSTINFIHGDKSGLWVGTLNGVFICTDWSATRLPATWIALSEEDGLRSPETNLNAVYRDRGGRIWFGTPDGVVRAEPAEVARLVREVIPGIVLSGLLINLQDLFSGAPAGEMRVNHRNRHFTFFCDAISMRYPGRTQFQYFLEGFDSDWGPPVNARSAVYGNLGSGTYTFLARARVGEGAWSEPVSFTFTILPPWWLSWWFIMGVAAGSGTLTGMIIRRRRKAILLAREMEMSEMRSRMLSLEQQSLNSSMNRHFIFNALNSIQYYINRQDRAAANKYLSDFARLIRKNLDSSQEETTTLRDELERLELYLRLEHMRFRDKFEYIIHVDTSLNQDQIRVPAMLLQPFLENSIWHGLLPKESGGIVRVDVHKKEEVVEFWITDNGVGIDESRNFKGESGGHISQGMQITRNRIDLLGRMKGRTIELKGPYQLNDDSGQPKGTQVCIKIPV